MAVSYIFDTKYHERKTFSDSNLAKGKYRIVIGDKSGTITDDGGGLDLFDPGMTIQWNGDQDKFMNAIMGSSLSMTARMDDEQLAIFENMLDQNEGDIFCLFFNTWSPDAAAIPYWYGHLLIESCAIRIENEFHTVDMTFTDGLASLRGSEWVKSNGDKYEGFMKLKDILREIVEKVPAYEAYEDWVLNENGDTYVPLLSESGFPDPRVDIDDEYDFHSGTPSSTTSESGWKHSTSLRSRSTVPESYPPSLITSTQWLCSKTFVRPLVLRPVCSEAESTWLADLTSPPSRVRMLFAISTTGIQAASHGRRV